MNQTFAVQRTNLFAKLPDMKITRSSMQHESRPVVSHMDLENTPAPESSSFESDLNNRSEEDDVIAEGEQFLKIGMKARQHSEMPKSSPLSARLEVNTLSQHALLQRTASE